MIKASSKNTVGKAIFYTFEICALVVGVFTLILGIYSGTELSSFFAFLQYFVSAITNTLLIYGLGKVIDLMYARKDGKCCKAENKPAEESTNQENKDAE